MAGNQRLTGIEDQPYFGLSDYPVFDASKLPDGTVNTGTAYDDRAKQYADLHVLPDGSMVRTVSDFDPANGVIYLRVEGN